MFLNLYVFDNKWLFRFVSINYFKEVFFVKVLFGYLNILIKLKIFIFKYKD